jgi:hypothetical protein
VRLILPHTIKPYQSLLNKEAKADVEEPLFFYLDEVPLPLYGRGRWRVRLILPTGRFTVAFI